MPDAPFDLRTTPGAVPIRRDVVLVSGPEAIGFLQGQLSQEIEGLAIGETTRSLLLQPTGKVDAWLRVTRLADDSVLLDVDEGAGEAVFSRLRRFKLRTKADLEPATWSGHALRGTTEATSAGPGVHALPTGWPAVGGVDLIGPGPSDPSVPTATAADLDALRIEAGVPAMGAEITEATIPAELGQWLIDASVSFTKGCYTGQELVARIDSRGGKVPRPVRGLVLEGDVVPRIGASVHSGDDEVGVITSSARSAALGPIALAPLARSAGIGASVVVDGLVAEVRELPLR